jgi:hypothetical protein
MLILSIFSLFGLFFLGAFFLIAHVNTVTNLNEDLFETGFHVSGATFLVVFDIQLYAGPVRIRGIAQKGGGGTCSSLV